MEYPYRRVKRRNELQVFVHPYTPQWAKQETVKRLSTGIFFPNEIMENPARRQIERPVYLLRLYNKEG